ncbi:MAG TPA: hypothetical protein VEB40_00005, partial [Flavipsychrobacter sp.]|nr:hypothetical protein [Flavipsychrobacter sp.]
MKKFFLLAGVLLACNITQAQQADGFTHLKTGLDYKIVKDAPGTRKAVAGDYMLMHLQRKSGGNLQFDSRTMNGNEPVPYPIQAAQFQGDPVEVLMMLTAGDSVIIKLPVDSLRKAGMQIPDNNLDMYIQVVDIKSKADMEAEAAKKAAAQAGIDDKLISEYLQK